MSLPWRPSRGPQNPLKALGYLACRVFQPRCRRLQFIETGERGVEVCLVEDLAAVDEVAVDRQMATRPPFGFDAFLRSPLRGVGYDRS